jgi:hypothetical protein
MKQHPNRLWIIALALGWAFDFLFWKKPAGINFAIFATLCMAGGLYMLLSNGIRPASRAWWLAAPFAFFAVISFLRQEPLTVFLAYSLTLFAMTVFVLNYLGGRWIEYSLGDYFKNAVALVASMVAQPVSFGVEARKTQAENGGVKKSLPIWPILRGLLIALPVVVIFASLLSSADVVFNQQLDKFVELFKLEKLPEYIFRGIYISIGAYLIAGTILHAATKSKDEKLVGEDKPVIAPFLGFTEASIVLGSVFALFLAFVIIQFQYFFGGNTNIRIDGYTYSEYAVRGFGELVTVAFFTLLMLLSLSGVTRRESENQRWAFSGLGVGLVALVLVMLVSAYQRLVLYESAYGFSRLRTYTHVVLIWIGLLLVATIVLEILRRERAFALAAILAALGFAVSLSLLNVDAFIVRRNVQREVHGQTEYKDDFSAASRVEGDALDAAYFLDLSDDAVPALVEAYRTPSLPAPVKEKVGAALACIRYERSLDNSDILWQSFHLSRFQADQSLALVKTSLDKFKVNKTDYPVMVTTPTGGEFSCSPYYYD